MTARGTWKSYERRIAADLGGRRIPVTGIDRAGADVECAMFNVQCKLRKTIPDWLFSWLGGIVATAQAQNKIGILILKQPRMRDTEAVVILRYQDWLDIVGGAGKPEC